MKVYRVEKRGRGPFSGGQAWNLGLIHCWGNPRFPCARVDYDDTPPCCVYGVQDRAILRSWFPKEVRRILRDAGYSLVVYNVPDHCVEIGQSGRQVRFRKAQAVAQHNLAWEHIK